MKQNVSYRNVFVVSGEGHRAGRADLWGIGDSDPREMKVPVVIRQKKGLQGA